MPQNQELCFADGAMPVLPTVRVLVGHAGRSPALCWVKPRSHRGCHQPLQCSDVSFPMCWQGEESWRRSQCLQVGNAYVIVYSITDRSSFESASELRIHLRRARQAEDIPIILVGNKSDLVRCREVSIEGERVRVCPHVPCYGSCYIPQYRGCQQGHTPSLTTPPPFAEGRACAVVFDCKFIETSAALQHNVDELFEGVVRQLRLRREGKESASSHRRKESLTKRARRFLDRMVARNSSKVALKARSKSCHDLSVL